MDARIDYWLKQDGEERDILTTDCHKVPDVGEVIHLDTRSDRNWHMLNFNTDRFWQEGVSGYFEVVSVKRFIRCFDTTVDDKIKDKTYRLPSKQIVEIFEVFLKPVEDQ